MNILVSLRQSVICPDGKMHNAIWGAEYDSEGVMKDRKFGNDCYIVGSFWIPDNNVIGICICPEKPAIVTQEFISVKGGQEIPAGEPKITYPDNIYISE